MGLLSVVNIWVVYEPICFHKKENAMNSVGIDLHKKTISICVVGAQRRILDRRRFLCCESDRILAYFTELGEFQAVIEATASYEWLWALLEPLAHRIVLAHPGKLRIIAESTRKSDKLDAQVLAEFLALDMIPQAYRPSPREREHRVLVRHRRYLSKRSTALRNKMRRILSDYSADREDLFGAAGTGYLKRLEHARKTNITKIHFAFVTWKRNGNPLLYRCDVQTALAHRAEEIAVNRFFEPGLLILFLQSHRVHQLFR